jgi:hypothetical protein
MRSSVEPRNAARISDTLSRHLSQYALAASAAGVGILALAQPAECKIVYTPAHTTIPANGGPVPLDLNHDGIADFSFVNSRWAGSEGAFRELLSVQAKSQRNEIWGKGSFYVSSLLPPKGGWNELFASALRPGFTVGPNKSYFQERSRGLMAMSGAASVSRSIHYFGQWEGDIQHRYLGFKFRIGKQAHYGWARLNVSTGGGPIRATLTGYAYETIPNKPIITGKTKGPDVITVQPGSLGALAAGRK